MIETVEDLNAMLQDISPEDMAKMNEERLIEHYTTGAAKDVDNPIGTMVREYTGYEPELQNGVKAPFMMNEAMSKLLQEEGAQPFTFQGQTYDKNIFRPIEGTEESESIFDVMEKIQYNIRANKVHKQDKVIFDKKASREESYYNTRSNTFEKNKEEFYSGKSDKLKELNNKKRFLSENMFLKLRWPVNLNYKKDPDTGKSYSVPNKKGARLITKLANDIKRLEREYEKPLQERADDAALKSVSKEDKELDKLIAKRETIFSKLVGDMGDLGIENKYRGYP